VNNLEQTIMREISTLPEAHQMDVLTFVRFLKVSLPDKEKTRSEFKKALKDARSTAKKYKITQADIDAEIQAVRDGK
jgi:rRNA maturation endonuclease Nob1